MMERYRANERHQDYRAAIIALPIINRGREEHERMHPEELFSSLAPKPTKPDPKQHANAFVAWAAAGFGKITRLDA